MKFYVIWHWNETYSFGECDDVNEARRLYTQAPADASRALLQDDAILDSFFFNEEWKRNILNAVVDALNYYNMDPKRAAGSGPSAVHKYHWLTNPLWM